MSKDVKMMRYIGSKKLLVEAIKELLDENITDNETTFLDLFAGTNSVANYFKPYYTIYANDILYFNYINAKATIENNEPIKFEKLKKAGIANPINYLQNIKIETDNYYLNNYSPVGQSMYFTEKNAKKIDNIRTQIQNWYDTNMINESEYFYLLNTLIEAIPFISNITGTYGAFLKHWDKRALNNLILKEKNIINNYRKNKAFNENANDLVKKIHADIVYIDPPYNNRQYASNYHVLENIARNNKPPLKGKTKIFDWKYLKSDYSKKNKALIAFKDLIQNINATHIIVSYNNEGIIPKNEIINVLKEQALDHEVIVKSIPYRKYKSINQSKTKELYEYLFYIKKKEPTKNNIMTKQKNNIQIINQKNIIKSPLNYIGGKYKLLNQILPLFPENIHTFVDLFSGGANVGINVKADKYIFNDMNTKINEMFRYFQRQDPFDLINKIESQIKSKNLSKTNEEAFIKFRTEYNDKPTPLNLYILAAYSYNYQFRFNNSMQYNNPFGKNRSHFSDKMKNNLLNFVTKLQTLNATFTDYYFDDLDLSFLTEQDFVYLDPPYLITTGSYNDGNRGFKNWTTLEELKMYELMLKLNKKNIKFALSNVLTHKGKTNHHLIKFTESNDFNIHYLNYNYKNSSYNTTKKESNEVLITNY